MAHGLGQPDDENVIDTWFALVLGVHDKVDVTVCLVRPGRATNVTRTECLGGGTAREHLAIIRDGDPVSVQRELGQGARACAVVDVLQMAPQPMSVSSILACATDAEVPVGA